MFDLSRIRTKRIVGSSHDKYVLPFVPTRTSHRFRSVYFCCTHHPRVLFSFGTHESSMSTLLRPGCPRLDSWKAHSKDKSQSVDRQRATRNCQTVPPDYLPPFNQHQMRLVTPPGVTHQLAGRWAVASTVSQSPTCRSVSICNHCWSATNRSVGWQLQWPVVRH